MFDPSVLLDDRPSVVEGRLRRWLDERAGGRFVIARDYRPHGRPAALPADADTMDIHTTGTHTTGAGTAGSGTAGSGTAGSDTAGSDTADTDTADTDTADTDSEPAEFGAFRRLLESGARHLAAARAAQREQARLAAVQARELAAFARQRPAAVLDRPEQEVGAAAAASRAARPQVLTEVSEWAVDEVSVALCLPARTAAGLLAEALTLVEQLPATLAALEAGVIGPAHARMLTEVLAPLGDEPRAEVEGWLLARAAGATVAQLRDAARRAVLRADASAAARRAAAAIRERRVCVYPGEEGMATLAATLPTPVALAARAALERYAEACAVPEDGRSKDQRMVDCLTDLILRPGLNPPVQVQLEVVATAATLAGGDEPGEVDGHPVPAAMVRELANALGLLRRPIAVTDRTETDSCDAVGTGQGTGESQGGGIGEQAAGGPVDERRETVALLSSDGQAAADLAGLLGVRTTAGTALAQLPTIAIVEELSGQLLALTDAAAIRRAAPCGRHNCRTGRRPCPHPPARAELGPPPPTTGYTPSDRLARFVRARDRRCRFPGCRARATVCDLDHNTPWPAGPTSAGNLCCLCRHHHRLSHQAPGWRMHRLADGGLQWTAPGGERLTTYPPRYGTEGDLPPPRPPSQPAATTVPPPLTPTERVLGRPLSAGTVDDDPAPF